MMLATMLATLSGDAKIWGRNEVALAPDLPVHIEGWPT